MVCKGCVSIPNKLANDPSNQYFRQRIAEMLPADSFDSDSSLLQKRNISTIMSEHKTNNTFIQFVDKMNIFSLVPLKVFKSISTHQKFYMNLYTSFIIFDIWFNKLSDTISISNLTLLFHISSTYCRDTVLC